MSELKAKMKSYGFDRKRIPFYKVIHDTWLYADRKEAEEELGYECRSEHIDDLVAFFKNTATDEQVWSFFGGLYESPELQKIYNL